MNLKQSVPTMSLLLLLVGFPQISETIYSPALPNIAHNLMTNAASVQWTLSIYFIGFAIGVFIWGWLSDHIGRRVSMLAGILIYIIATIFCATAHSIDWLLVSRLIQGIGASVGSVLTQAIARESLDDKGRNHFFSMQGFVMAFAISVGPFFGGYLTQWFDWRSNFVLLALIGISLILLSFFKLPETRIKQEHTERRNSKLSKVFKQMITDKSILSSLWIVGAATGILFSYYAEGPFIFIRLIRLTPSQYGWLGLFIAIAALLGSLTSKKLTQHYNADKITLIGIGISLVSSLGLICVSLLTSISSHNKIYSTMLIIIPMMGLIFAAFGFLLPATLSRALLKYKYALGQAGALFGLGYYLLDALFTWIMGWINNGKIWTMPVYFGVLCLSIAFAFYIGIKQKAVNPDLKLKI
jgi:Bcr/CflA subfamily drug resistance transporter